jgi:hypothetical protein
VGLPPEVQIRVIVMAIREVPVVVPVVDHTRRHQKVEHTYVSVIRPTERGAGVSRCSDPGPMTNKQVESCFLNHNLSIHFCCTDSLLMTHRGGLSLSIIIWRIGGGEPSFLLPWGPRTLLAAMSVMEFEIVCACHNPYNK